MEKGEFLLDEDELVGRTTAVHVEADDHGGVKDDHVVTDEEGVGEEAVVHRHEDEAEEKILEGRRRGEIRENILRGRESGPSVRRGRESHEGHGFGSKRTKLAVAMVALGVVGVVGLWWAHGRVEVARGTSASERVPPELAKVLGSVRAVASRHSLVPSHTSTVFHAPPAVGTPLAGQHRIVVRAPVGKPKQGGLANRKVVAPVVGKAILAKPGSSLMQAGIQVLAPAGGKAPAGSKAPAGVQSTVGNKAPVSGKALWAGESSRGSTLAPAVRHGTIPSKDTVVEEIRSLKAEMAGVKAELENERKAVGTLPDVDKRLLALHGALEKLLKNAEAGSHAKVRHGKRGKKGKARAEGRRVKRVMGYRLLAVVGDQAVVEDMGTGRVRVLRANGRLGGLVVYQVAGGAVVTNYGVMGGNNE